MNLPFEGNLRRKDAYEAADAGLIIWRKNFAYFIIFFIIPFLTFAFCLRLLPGNLVYLSWLILWYLKPFFDRTILHVISLKFFEPEAGIKRLLKGLGKNLRRGLVGDLIWRRFSPLRASTLPLRVLETSEKANKYSHRKKLLDKGGLGYSFFLTFWGVSLEIALLIGEYLFIIMMAYFIGIDADFGDFDFFIDSEKYFFALWCVNYIIAETIYICMGFSVYINSRIEVEGWDIEILFKNFAEKLKKKKTLGVLSVIFFLFVFNPSPVSAEVVSIETASIEAPPLEILEEILSSPDFGYEKDSWEIKLKNPPEEKEKIDIRRYRYNSILDKLRLFFASGLRAFIVVIAAAAAIVIFFFARRFFKKRNTVTEEKPVVTVLQEIPQDNPQELLEKAAEFYNQNLRLAWGYCTAAAILSLQLYRSISFPPNATEYDCANIASAELENKDEANRFCTLIKTWISFAYAGRIPQDDSFEEAVAFCKLLSEKGSIDG